jgi:hypothetical protein
MILNGRCFETVSDIQRESQVVLNNIKENYIHGAFEAWKKKDGIYVPKETILKEMAAKIELSQHFFFDLVWELSNTPHIWLTSSILPLKRNFQVLSRLLLVAKYKTIMTSV